MIGDSHANHLFPGLKSSLDAQGENLILLAKSGTPPLIGVIAQRKTETSLDDVFAYVLSQPTIHTVLISGFWASYFERKGVKFFDYSYKGYIDNPSEPTEASKHSLIVTNGLTRTAQKILSANKRLVIFYEIPVMPFPLGKCLPRPFLANESECKIDLAAEQRIQAGYREAIAKTLAEYPDVKTFDPIPILCETSSCPVVRDQMIVYSDDFHLSIQGSEFLFRNFRL